MNENDSEMSLDHALSSDQNVPEDEKKIFYPWQLDAFSAIRGRSAVLAAPTGSGKTWVAYLWAGLYRENGEVGEVSPEEKIIFTAPIKALSNERYMDLRRMGFDTGIETGDFKKNAEAPIICCTQEIYALKYAGRSGIRLIIDEFHYIFGENERSRAYIDGIRKTADDVPILVMSATFGDPDNVKSYLDRITERSFALFESTKRVTDLIFRRESTWPTKIHDALVFVFSQKEAMHIADIVARERRRFDPHRRRRLEDLAWILEVDDIRRCMFKGIGVYHGGLLPKEKLLVERAYRERIIDVVVGTDALALGVNLPAETVIFAQLVKYHNRLPISKNAFLQMSGRAGRKGLFEKGYVTWLADSPAESRGSNTGQVFRRLVSQPVESARVELRPDYGAILKGISTMEEEADIVAFGSLPELDYGVILDEIRDSMRKISRIAGRIIPGKKKEFKMILADVWYGEMEVEQNIAMAELFFWNTQTDSQYHHPEAMEAADIVRRYERNYLQALLKVKRYNNSLPVDYRFNGMDELNAAIENMDPTVFGFEEKIYEMEKTQIELPASKVKIIKRRRGQQEPRRRRSSGRRSDGGRSAG